MSSSLTIERLKIPGLGHHTIERVASPDGLEETFRVVSVEVGVGETLLFQIGEEKVVEGLKVAVMRPFIVTEVVDGETMNGMLLLTPEDTRFSWPQDHLFFRLTPSTCIQCVSGIKKGSEVGQWRRK